MTPRERYLSCSLKPTTDVPMYANCTHYMRHYIESADGNGYTPIADGHCTTPNIKIRKPYDICGYYERKER